MRVKLDTKITTQEGVRESSVLGILEEGHVLKYKENDTVVVLDMKKDELMRENDTFHFSYKFLENGETFNDIFVKEFGKQVTLKIYTNQILRGSNRYLIEYTLVEEKSRVSYEVCWRDAG